MPRFIESIRLNNGVFDRITLHQERVNRIFHEFFPENEPVSIVKELSFYDFPKQGLFKVRFIFDDQCRKVEFIPYFRRNIKSLRLLETDIENRFYKLENRAEFEAAFADRKGSDDVLLVKNGLLTDISYANIALFDGEKWVTPRLPLISGVHRSELLAHGKIFENDIYVDELINYQRIIVFNAMILWGEIILHRSQIIL